MNAAAMLIAIVLAGCTAPLPARQGGIVSTNPCADAILIELVAPQRIAAISHYSRDPATSSIPLATARRFPAISGTAEEVIALDPALVLTSSFTPLATRSAYARAGLKTVVLDSPTTVTGSKAQIMQIAAAVGEASRGLALNARIDRALRAGAPGDRRQPRALLYISGNLVTGAGTLLHELLVRAGFEDAAARYGLASTATLGIETIASDPPDVILSPDVGARTASLRHKVLARSGARTIDARFPRQLVNCGGPIIIPAMARLAQVRRGL